QYAARITARLSVGWVETMKHTRMAAGILIVGLLVAPIGAGAESPESKSAQTFVQDFYTWYGQEEKNEHDMALSDYAIKTKPQLFTAAIVQGLKEDEAAQAKVPGEVVGLDFDPILNAQDDCGPYKAGKVKVMGATYRVELFDHCSDSKPARPAVIAAVQKQKGSWVFVDFIYPGSGDLFSELQSLKKEREKSGKRE
ncbi:MAG TPA: hypothetical protein VGT42_02525, partial [Gammaproteobacteria bacterium]|nr:hypothetical protein [Gammaproteobacteria bacterium]